MGNQFLKGSGRAAAKGSTNRTVRETTTLEARKITEYQVKAKDGSTVTYDVMAAPENLQRSRDLDPRGILIYTGRLANRAFAQAMNGTLKNNSFRNIVRNLIAAITPKVLRPKIATHYKEKTNRFFHPQNNFVDAFGTPRVLTAQESLHQISKLKNWHGHDGTNVRSEGDLRSQLADPVLAKKVENHWILPTQTMALAMKEVTQPNQAGAEPANQARFQNAALYLTSTTMGSVSLLGKNNTVVQLFTTVNPQTSQSIVGGAHPEHGLYSARPVFLTNRRVDNPAPRL
ncbi:MAG: hypothetical protein EB059_04425 [Alphaproteobacteria bacterium]|nr:hypothetical protein [Alphaproteobacteria bacterium]